MVQGRPDPGLGCRIGRAIQAAKRLCFPGAGAGCLRVDVLGLLSWCIHTHTHTYHTLTHTYGQTNTCQLIHMHTLRHTYSLLLEAGAFCLASEGPLSQA